MMVSTKVSFGRKGFKYFFGYKDDRKFRPVRTMLPKMIVYKRDFDEA